MELKIEVNDIRSQIFFVIHVDDYNLMLHVKFQPSISIFRTKCSLYKIWCHKVSNCTPLPFNTAIKFNKIPVLLPGNWGMEGNNVERGPFTLKSIQLKHIDQRTLLVIFRKFQDIEMKRENSTTWPGFLIET